MGGLIGAPIGAGLGLLGSVGSKRKRKNMFGDTLMGGLLGGAAGAGLGGAYQLYNGAGGEKTTEQPPSAEASAQPRGKPGELVSAGFAGNPLAAAPKLPKLPTQEDLNRGMGGLLVAGTRPGAAVQDISKATAPTYDAAKHYLWSIDPEQESGGSSFPVPNDIGGTFERAQKAIGTPAAGPEFSHLNKQLLEALEAAKTSPKRTAYPTLPAVTGFGAVMPQVQSWRDMEDVIAKNEAPLQAARQYYDRQIAETGQPISGLENPDSEVYRSPAFRSFLEGTGGGMIARNLAFRPVAKSVLGRPEEREAKQLADLIREKGQQPTAGKPPKTVTPPAPETKAPGFLGRVVNKVRNAPINPLGNLVDKVHPPFPEVKQYINDPALVDRLTVALNSRGKGFPIVSRDQVVEALKGKSYPGVDAGEIGRASAQIANKQFRVPGNLHQNDELVQELARKAGTGPDDVRQMLAGKTPIDPKVMAELQQLHPGVKAKGTFNTRFSYPKHVSAPRVGTKFTRGLGAVSRAAPYGAVEAIIQHGSNRPSARTALEEALHGGPEYLDPFSGQFLRR